MALWAVPVAARMIAVVQVPALFAAIDLTTQRGRAALQDGLQRPFLARQDRQSRASFRPGGAEDIRHFEHENLGLGTPLVRGSRSKPAAVGPAACALRRLSACKSPSCRGCDGPKSPG